MAGRYALFLFPLGGETALNRNAELAELLRPVVEGLGCQLWGLELSSQQHRSVLRVYIEKEAGVTIDDCEKVSRQISAVMDVEDPISSRYTLEVSSPGWDRPLFEEWQFQMYLGGVVDVRLSIPFEGRRRFKGQLTQLEDSEITLVVDGEAFCFPLEAIDRANVVPQF